MKKIFTLFFACFVCAMVVPVDARETCQFTNDGPTISQIIKMKALISTSLPMTLNAVPVVGLEGAMKITAARLKDVKDRADLICVGDAQHCFQCDRHNAGRLYECYSDDAVVVANDKGVFVRKCQFKRHVGKDAKSKLEYFLPFWGAAQLAQEYVADIDGIGEWTPVEEVPLCKDSKNIENSEKGSFGSYLSEGHERADGVWVTGHNVCLRYDCKSGYTYNSGARKCEKQGDVAQPSKPSNNTNPTYGGKKSCRDQHKKDGAERLACCDVEDAKTGWWQDGACHCNNKSATFKVLENGTGWCEVKSGDNQQLLPVVCTDKENMDAECNCKPKYTHKENGYCKCDDINARLVDGACSCAHISGAKLENGSCVCGKDKEVSGNQCGYTKEYLNRLKIDIDNKYSKLTSITAGFKQSEWRDAEGEFNTARLASDSIAGVVLGTVGGVVTSHLVKKAQVKQGFEDLQCYIGGQSVADWGDGFVVGR